MGAVDDAISVLRQIERSVSELGIAHVVADYTKKDGLISAPTLRKIARKVCREHKRPAIVAYEQHYHPWAASGRDKSLTKRHVYVRVPKQKRTEKYVSALLLVANTRGATQHGYYQYDSSSIWSFRFDGKGLEIYDNWLEQVRHGGFDDNVEAGASCVARHRGSRRGDEASAAAASKAASRDSGAAVATQPPA